MIIAIQAARAQNYNVCNADGIVAIEVATAFDSLRGGFNHTLRSLRAFHPSRCPFSERLSGQSAARTAQSFDANRQTGQDDRRRLMLRREIRDDDDKEQSSCRKHTSSLCSIRRELDARTRQYLASRLGNAGGPKN